MVQIQLEDNIAEALVHRARSRGLGLEEFLAEVAANDAISSPLHPKGDEVVRLIEVEASAGNPAYKGTYSREDIYIDHD